MENVSKAVIMLGGVLISMGIIGIAVLTYSNAQNLASASEEAMSASQIESFNRFYTAYRTTYNGPTKLKCIDAVNILNRAVEDEIAVTLNSSVIEEENGHYVAEPEHYLTKELNYTITFLNGIGVVSRVTIND